MPRDRFYGVAAEELTSHSADKDLFARAYAMALGDADKTKTIYIGIRAERLELLAHEQAAENEKKISAQKTADKRREAHFFKQPILHKPLPKPEDFSDPKMAEAVRAMIAALGVSEWRPSEIRLDESSFERRSATKVTSLVLDPTPPRHALALPPHRSRP
ncbi:MAG: hypothetical protein H7343_01215 [Undibacterium sp.]|nr:hypothetical protein [Opitutaceae bacterium]